MEAPGEAPLNRNQIETKKKAKRYFTQTMKFRAHRLATANESDTSEAFRLSDERMLFKSSGIAGYASGKVRLSVR